MSPWNEIRARSEKDYITGSNTLRMEVFVSLQGVIPSFWTGRDLLKLSGPSLCLQVNSYVRDHPTVSFESLIRELQLSFSEVLRNIKLV